MSALPGILSSPLHRPGNEAWPAEPFCDLLELSKRPQESLALQSWF